MASNRGNYLLMALLKFRFPTLFESENQETYAKSVLSKHLEKTVLTPDSEALCKNLLQSYLADREASYPVYIGESLEEDLKNQLVLYLVSAFLNICFKRMC